MYNKEVQFFFYTFMSELYCIKSVIYNMINYMLLKSTRTGTAQGCTSSSRVFR